MSDALTESGPASASDSQKTGRFAEEARQGYREMPSYSRDEKPATPERTFETGRQAADALAERRRKQGHAEGAAREVGYWTDNKSYVAPDNETVDLKRASDDLKAHRQVDSIDAELTSRHDLANKVDKLRKEANVPTVIDHNAPPDLENVDPRLFGDMQHTQPTEPSQPQIEQAPQTEQDHLAEAFRKNPRLAQAVEKEVGRAAEAEKAFGDGLKVAQNAAIASFAAFYPEFVGKSPAQVAQAFAHMQKTNPARAQQAQAAFQNAVKFEAALKQNEARVQQAEQQNFQRFAREQDQIFERRMAGHTPQQRQAIGAEIISYAQELGVDQKTLTHLMATSPIMRHSAFATMMTEAAAHRLAKRSLEAQRQQNRAPVPRVAQPGHSNNGARHSANANLQALSAKLSQTGSAKDAAALLLARRKQGR
jgi:hypothetical protein